MRLVLFLFLVLCCGWLHAQTEADSLRQLAAAAPADSTRLKYLMDLAYVYEFENRDSAIAVYNEAFVLADALNNDLYRGRSIQYRSIVMHDMGRYAESIVGNNKALVYFQRIGFEKGIASTYNNMGNSYLYLADYHNALQYYLLAKPYYTRAKDYLSLVTINGNMGESYRQLGEPSRMLEVAKESFQFAQATGDPMEVANAAISMGSAWSLNGAPDSSEIYLQRALQIGEEMQSDQVLFYALFDLADAKLRHQKAHDALPMATRALDMSLRLEDAYKQTGIHILLGKILTELPDQKTQALDHLQRAEQLATSIAADDQRLLALDALANYHERNGNLENALVYKKAWIGLNDSIFNEEKSRQISALHTLYELEEKEKTIADERLLNKAKDEKIRARNIQTAMAVGLAVLVAAVAWFVWKSQRNKRQLAEQGATILQQQNEALLREQKALQLQSLLQGQEEERKRLARELHDGLGGYLTSVHLKAQQLQKESGNTTLLQEVTDMVSTAGKEMRKISHALAPEGLLHLGLVEALQQYAARLSTSQCTITFESHGEAWSSETYSEQTVYRMVQELLNNVLKHAQATEAFVALSYLSHELHVVVEDNGRGFDAQGGTPNGHGLNNLYARAAFMNATVDVVSKPGQGTSITILIPQAHETH